MSLLLENYDLRLNTSNSATFEAHSTQYKTECSKFSIDDGNVKIGCPQIHSIKIDSFYQCINATCNSKVSVFSDEYKAVCDSCKRKILVKCLIKNSNIESELQDKVTGCGTTVTVFENMLENLFKIDELTPEE